jgi:hypothetical protein
MKGETFVANFFKRDEKDALADAKNALYAEEEAKQQRIEQLAKVGQINLKEAAIVFSYDGFGTFVNMLCNSVDRIIEERVSQIIEGKMLEVMEGMKIGMQRSMESMSEQVLGRYGLAPKQEEKQISFDLQTSQATEEPIEDEVPVMQPEPEIITVAGNLPDIAPSFEIENKFAAIIPEASSLAENGYTANKQVLEKLSNIIRKPEPVQNVRVEVKQPKSVKFVGAKATELRHWAPIFAEYLIDRPNKKIPLYEITAYMSAKYSVKFKNPAHVTNVVLELYPSITKPEKGFYIYKPKN